jgi:hypothetical protein
MCFIREYDSSLMLMYYKKNKQEIKKDKIIYLYFSQYRKLTIIPTHTPFSTSKSLKTISLIHSYS